MDRISVTKTSFLSGKIESLRVLLRLPLQPDKGRNQLALNLEHLHTQPVQEQLVIA